jgi:hypothetical protein
MHGRPVTKVKYVQTKTPNKVIRVGECNNCGICCQIFKRPEAPKNSPYYAETPRYEYCAHYLPNGMYGHCGIYTKRSKECREYPRGPMDILNKPECSYQFFDEYGRKIDAYMDKRVRLQIVGQVKDEDYPFTSKF